MFDIGRSLALPRSLARAPHAPAPASTGSGRSKRNAESRANRRRGVVTVDVAGDSERAGSMANWQWASRQARRRSRRSFNQVAIVVSPVASGGQPTESRRVPQVQVKRQDTGYVSASRLNIPLF